MDLKKLRASTNKNKNAISLIDAKMEVLPLLIFCISHGYSGCSMQHDAYYNFLLAPLPSSDQKYLTKMVQFSREDGPVQFSMCKSPTFFLSCLVSLQGRVVEFGGVKSVEVKHADAEQTNDKLPWIGIGIGYLDLD